jgi:hypothetical protein
MKPAPEAIVTLDHRAVVGQEATFDSRPKIVGNLERCQ